VVVKDSNAKKKEVETNLQTGSKEEIEKKLLYKAGGGRLNVQG